MRDRGLVVHNWAGKLGFCNDPDQFSTVTICNYYTSDAYSFGYSVRRMNEYYCWILQMSDAGWPGSLRWMQGEGGPLLNR